MFHNNRIGNRSLKSHALHFFFHVGSLALRWRDLFVLCTYIYGNVVQHSGCSSLTAPYRNTLTQLAMTPYDYTHIFAFNSYFQLNTWNLALVRQSSVALTYLRFFSSSFFHRFTLIHILYRVSTYTHRHEPFAFVSSDLVRRFFFLFVFLFCSLFSFASIVRLCAQLLYFLIFRSGAQRCNLCELYASSEPVFEFFLWMQFLTDYIKHHYMVFSPTSNFFVI